MARSSRAARGQPILGGQFTSRTRRANCYIYKKARPRVKGDLREFLANRELYTNGALYALHGGESLYHTAPGKGILAPVVDRSPAAEDSPCTTPSRKVAKMPST